MLLKNPLPIIIAKSGSSRRFAPLNAYSRVPVESVCSCRTACVFSGALARLAFTGVPYQRSRGPVRSEFLNSAAVYPSRVFHTAVVAV